MDKHGVLELAHLYKNNLSQIFLVGFIMQQFLHINLGKKLSSRSKQFYLRNKSRTEKSIFQ